MTTPPDSLLRDLPPGLIKLFIDTTREHLCTVRRLSKQGDVEAVASPAHAVAGAAYVVGAGSIGDAAKALETAARNGEGHQAQAAEQALHERFEAFVQRHNA